MADGALAGTCIPVFIFLVMATVISGQTVEIYPKEATVLPGNNLTVLCQVAYSIAYCRIEITGHPNSYTLSPGQGENGINYYGSGLDHGQCGVSIDRVLDANHGEIKCTIPPQSGSKELFNKMKLIVAKPPLPPAIEYNRGTEGPTVYKVGDELRVRCIVAEGRPAARISWYLDDMPLMEGLHQPTIYHIPNSLDLDTSAQNLTRRLQTTDNAKTLRCVAEHPALNPGNSQAQMQLSVQYMPTPREDPIWIFGIKIGETGLVNVTLQAQPAPRLEWIFDGQSIQGGSVDNTERFEATNAIPLGNGTYNATLRIAGVTREDTEKEYLLKAYNDQGLTEYRVRISTMDEPQGVDFGVGAIIGIVVAVLIVLIAVFLTIFAKATNRWCFGDGVVSRKSKARNVGESSDTESADAGHLSRAREEAGVAETPKSKDSPMARAFALPKAINFKALLPGGVKNKDKVAQAENPAPENKADEEAKPLQDKGDPQEQGLVYAVLALRPNPEQETKVPTDRTEYAEIVYNQNPIENKLENKENK